MLKGKYLGTSRASYIKVVVRPSGKVQVWTKTSGKAAVLRGTISTAFVAGDRLGARVRSDGIVTVYKNGAVIGTANLVDRVQALASRAQQFGWSDRRHLHRHDPLALRDIRQLRRGEPAMTRRPSDLSSDHLGDTAMSESTRWRRISRRDLLKAMGKYQGDL